MGISVIVADDHTVVRTGIRLMLESIEDVSVVGECSDGLEVVKMVRKINADILIIDTAMPNMNGIDATRHISTKYPTLKTLTLSAREDRASVLNAFAAGTKGYLLKTCSADELISAIRAVNRGKTYISPDIAHLVVGVTSGDAESAIERLTSKERVVLQQLAEGLNARESSVAMGVSEKTISAHRDRLKKKLDISSIAGLTKFAVKNNLVEL